MKGTAWPLIDSPPHERIFFQRAKLSLQCWRVAKKKLLEGVCMSCAWLGFCVPPAHPSASIRCRSSLKCASATKGKSHKKDETAAEQTRATMVAQLEADQADITGRQVKVESRLTGRRVGIPEELTPGMCCC